MSAMQRRQSEQFRRSFRRR